MDIDIDIHSLSPEEFSQCKLVDIREPNEYAHVPALTDKVDYVPFAQFPSNIGYFNPQDRYLLVCAAGGRSHYMAEALASQGIQASSINYGIASLNSYLKKNV